MTPVFTLFLLSRPSDNTTSQNIGGTDEWAIPHLKFGGASPQFPVGLRPRALGRSLYGRLVFGGSRSRRTCDGLSSIERKSLSSAWPTGDGKVGALSRHEVYPIYEPNC